MDEGGREESGRGSAVVPRARCRAMVALASMTSGFLAAREIGRVVEGGVHSGAWFGVALVLGALALVFRGRACAALLAAMVALVGGGWFTLRILEGPADRLELPVEPEEAVVCVEGVVVEGAAVPRARGALAEFAIGGTASRFVMEVRRAARADGAWRGASGRLVVYVDGPEEGFVLPPGRWVRVSGRAMAAGGPTNPGQSDQRLWAAQEGIVGTMSVPDAGLVEDAAGEPGLLEPVLRGVQRAREWLAARARAGIESIGHERARALVASLMLGAEEEEGRAIATRFQRLGLAHVLAISGVHMTMLAWATLLAVRLCGDFGAIEPLIAACAVGLYLAVVPAEAPIVRSGVMVLAILLGEALGRRYDGVVILAWTAAALLLVRPMDLWSLGFQLSFGVTGVLLGAGRVFSARVWGERSPLVETTRDPVWWRRWIEGGKQAVSASVLAWAVASGWIAARVGLFSPVAPVSSLVVGGPIAALMVAGFVSMLIGTLVPGGEVVWLATEPLARLTLACVDWLDTLPGSSMATGSVPLAWGAAASVGALWVLTRGSLRPGPVAAEAAWHGRWRGALTWGVVAGLAAWLAIAVTLGRSLGRGVVLRLDTLDVGDATCHVVRSGEEAMLWDCGSSWAGAGEVRIPGAVRSLGAGPVRTALVTHANFDHFNALPDAAWRLGVRRVLVSGLLLERAEREPRGATAAMLELLREQGVEVVEVGAGDRVRLGEAEIEFVWPAESEAREWAVNDQSLVAVISAPTRGGSRRVLMTGDVQSRAIAAMVGEGGARDAAGLSAEVMEAPHHGAFTREAAGLVEEVGPRVVVQSTGRTRVGMGRVGDPRWEEASGGAAWMTTATDGAFWVEVRHDGSVVTGRHVPALGAE